MTYDPGRFRCVWHSVNPGSNQYSTREYITSTDEAYREVRGGHSSRKDRVMPVRYEGAPLHGRRAFCPGGACQTEVTQKASFPRRADSAKKNSPHEEKGRDDQY